jgi:uncharacterized protein YmfQ (DUF2313 family)
MATPVFTDEAFHQALLRLLPRGRAWRRDPLAIMSGTMAGLAPTYTRNSQAAAQLIIDARPDTTVNLLEEWEASLGLPDPCTAPNPTLAQRQAAVRAKWAERGALDKDYYIDLANILGYSITITEFHQMTVGMPVGSPMYGPDWNYTWQVNAPQITITPARVGKSACPDPLASWDGGELECRIRMNAPAGTIVLFAYH